MLYVIDILFPRSTGDSADKPAPAARTVANRTPVDYFERIIQVKRPKEEESDQRILRATKNWNENTSDELVNIIVECHSISDNRFERWLDKINDNIRFFDLTADVLKRKADTNSEKKFDEGRRALWRKWYLFNRVDTPEFSAKATEWFRSVFDYVFPKDVRFASEIYTNFALQTEIKNQDSSIRFCGFPESHDVNKVFIQAARNTLNSPQAIAKLCWGHGDILQSPSILSCLVRNYCHHDNLKRDYGKVSAFSWIGTLLLDGFDDDDIDVCNKIRALTAGLVVSLGSSSHHGIAPPTDDVRRDNLLGIFGADAQKVMEKLADTKFTSRIYFTSEQWQRVLQVV